MTSASIRHASPTNARAAVSGRLASLMSPSHPTRDVPMRIPEAISWSSKTYPNAPFYLYATPDSSTTSRPVVTITHLEFGRATHRAAKALRPNREGSNGEVVALIALSDTILYHAVIVGLITANLIPFPISPRNSAAAVVGLLRKTSCHRIVTTRVTLDALFTGIREELNNVDPEFALSIEEIPSLAQIYPNLGAETLDSPFELYPTSPTPPSFDDLCLYLHSSGSTGLPKAIPQTHKAVVQWTELDFAIYMRDSAPHPFSGMAIPGFHLSGLHAQLLQPVYGMIPVAVYPPTATSPSALPMFPSPDNIIENSRKTNCGSMVTLPGLIAAIARSPDGVDFLKGLHVVGFSGGTLPQRVGNSLVDAGVKLQSVYAATEFGVISAMTQFAGDEREWEWVRFPDEVNIRWAPQEDGTFELQILNSEKHTVGIENLPDVRGYGTSDSWRSHPEKKHLWKMVGRIDDVIVHTSGEKTVPGPIEDLILGSSLISGALMFGWEHDQAGIIIEPIRSLQPNVQDDAEVAELRNKIWPIIDEANQSSPAFSRIFKEMIIFTAADKPFPRAAKNTVMRKAALKLYAPEIDALYNVVDEKTNMNESIKPPDVWEAAPIQSWLLELAAELSKLPQIAPDVDLFHQGFDSLSATFLRLRVLKAIRSSKDPAIQKAAAGVNQNLVYAHPTIAKLSAFLAGLVSGTSVDVNAVDAKQLIESLVAKYTSGLIAPPTPFDGDVHVVLLTGSTGNLGSEILMSLLKDARVTKVYAFNRPPVEQGLTLADRQSAAFVARGLDVTLLDSSKLHLLEGQTDQANLGLNDTLYNELRTNVTLIIHNSWKLDFNLNLASFEPHVLGTRHLVDLALSSQRGPKFLFTSSIASGMSWDTARGPCPEELLSPDAAVGSSGYGQSKFVAEQIIAKSGLPATSLRIGQICGSKSTGAWATSDWIPILVKTSLALGILPTAEGLVSWIDFDAVTHAIMDVGFATADTSPVFNIVHPRPVSWNAVMADLREASLKNKLNTSPELALVPFTAWFTALEASATKTTADSTPGIKLLDFFSRLSKASEISVPDSEFGAIDFSTKKIQAISSGLSNAEVIRSEHVEAWIRYWSASGFI